MCESAVFMSQSNMNFKFKTYTRTPRYKLNICVYLPSREAANMHPKSQVNALNLKTRVLFTNRFRLLGYFLWNTEEWRVYLEILEEFQECKVIRRFLSGCSLLCCINTIRAVARGGSDPPSLPLDKNVMFVNSVYTFFRNQFAKT